MALKLNHMEFPLTTKESIHIEALAVDVSLDIWQNLLSPEEDSELTAFSTHTVELGCMISISFLKKESKKSKIRRSLIPLQEYLEYAESLGYNHVFLRVG